jgi:hypothetical protein
MLARWKRCSRFKIEARNKVSEGKRRLPDTISAAVVRAVAADVSEFADKCWR